MIVGQMALCRFPLWDKCLHDLLQLVDKVYLRFDGLVGERHIPAVAESICGEKFGGLLVSTSEWNPYVWREEMLRMLDDIHPDLVLVPDEDECFGDGIECDIQRFMANSKYSQLAFRYDNPTVDGWKWYKSLPYKPHVKAFKWKPGLTFLPYRGRARLRNYKDKDYIIADSRIQHYCFWNEAIRAEKLKGSKAKMQWVKRQIGEKK